MKRGDYFLFLGVVLSVALTSCGGIKMNKHKLIRQDVIDVCLLNQAEDEKGNKLNKTFLQLFNIYDQGVDSIFLKLKGDVMEFSYKYESSELIELRKYKTRLSNKGHFETFLKNIDRKIPPIIPFYVDVDVDLRKIQMTIDNKLVVEERHEKGSGAITYRIKRWSEFSFFNVVNKD